MEQNLESIDAQLNELRPQLEKRCWTERAWKELGANALLEERHELLERIKMFEEVFNPDIIE